MQPFEQLKQRSQAVGRWLTNPANPQQRNIRNVLLDGAGIGMSNAIGTFLSVFMVRLGAMPLLIGLITSMPALTGMLLAIPVGRWIERQRNIVPWYSRSRLWVICSYAVMGMVPFFFANNLAPIPIIVIWAISTVPQTIVNVTFTLVMSAVAGPTQRYYLMSRRWSLVGVVSAITIALISLILHQFSFPLNYQIVFISSLIGAALSFSFAIRIKVPDNMPPAAATQTRSWRSRLSNSIDDLRANASYSKFLISQFVFQSGVALAAPLYPLFWVRTLNASDAQIGAINTVNSGVLLVAYFLWSAISQRRGNPTVLRVCTFGVSCYPLFTSLTHSASVLPMYAGLSSICSAGLDLVLFDILISTCPPQRTAPYIALYQTTTYVAAFSAPFLGTLIASNFGYTAALIGAASLCFSGALLFTLLKVGVPNELAKA